MSDTTTGWYCPPADLGEAQRSGESHLERAGPQIIHPHRHGEPCTEDCALWPPPEEGTAE